MTTTTPKNKRGDVVLTLFPHSDLRTAKLRPALIIQAANLAADLSQVVITMITSRLFRANHSSKVLIRLSTPQGQQSRRLSDSVVMTDNIATILDTEIDRVIGTTPMDEVDKALKYTLAL